MPYNAQRYPAFHTIPIQQRKWPNRVVDKAPQWCSVDLRDGNQALAEPMGSARKLQLFELLVRIGFKQIEVGFPAASQTDFDFVRRLIGEGKIPNDVTIQVLVQARKELIERTFAALQGAPKAIVHLYNSTSELQRRVVFAMDRAAIRALAVQGTSWVREQASRCDSTKIILEYSPESFTGTELDFAVEICDAVSEVWAPSDTDQMIVNLPATVEMSTPNIYADQVEWMISQLARRSACIVSVHTHNDRGTAVAATELAMMAGAERVEGTLFGNGERTGNVDLVTLALNLFSQGVDPELDFGNLPEIVGVYEECCNLPVHPRHPYAGELVFTAFSGSHQDAIKKGLDAMSTSAENRWEVPYLPIDPSDVGRQYEPLVRINSQSGKGGLAFVLERAAGYRIPKALAASFSKSIQRLTDKTGRELTSDDVVEQFEREYLKETTPLRLASFDLGREPTERCSVSATLVEAGRGLSMSGEGNGPIDAFIRAANVAFGMDVHCMDYAEHALGTGEDAEAVAYVQLRGNSREAWGVARANDIVAASLHAATSAISQLKEPILLA